jgi:hypothetical protein
VRGIPGVVESDKSPADHATKPLVAPFRVLPRHALELVLQWVYNAAHGVRVGLPKPNAASGSRYGNRLNLLYILVGVAIGGWKPSQRFAITLARRAEKRKVIAPQSASATNFRSMGWVPCAAGGASFGK